MATDDLLITVFVPYFNAEYGGQVFKFSVFAKEHGRGIGSPPLASAMVIEDREDATGSINQYERGALDRFVCATFPQNTMALQAHHQDLPTGRPRDAERIRLTVV